MTQVLVCPTCDGTLVLVIPDTKEQDPFYVCNQCRRIFESELNLMEGKRVPVYDSRS